MLQNILFPFVEDFRVGTYSVWIHYVVAVVFTVMSGVITIDIIGLEIPLKVFYILWGFGVIFGHFQYFFAKKKKIEEIDYPGVYLWLAWAPLSIAMVVQSLLILFIHILIKVFEIVDKFYKKQLHKILKID